MRPELRHRLLFGFILGILLLGGVWSDLHSHVHLALTSIALIAVILGSVEYTRLARAVNANAQLFPLITINTLIVSEALLHQPSSNSGWLHDAHIYLNTLPIITLLLGLGLAWSVIQQMFRHAAERFFANVGSTILGMIYLGVSLNLVLRLVLVTDPSDDRRGVFLTLLFLAAVKGGDIGAYFGGRAFGRHKLAPRISPGKTWEGFFCSFFGAIAAVFLFRALLMSPLFGLSEPFDATWKLFVWAVLLAPLGVMGDLAESCMKRDAAVKDSGQLLPGFGGVLDILDAILIAAPVAYLLAIVL